MSKQNARHSVCHIISGDIWAGAESSAYNTIIGLSETGIFNVHVILFNNGILRDRLISKNIHVYVIEEDKENIFSFIIKLRRLININDIDIIHVHGYKETITAGIAIIGNNKRIIIRTFHGKGMIGYGYISRVKEWLCYRSTNVSIFVSHDLQRYIVDNGYYYKSSYVLHNAIDIKCNSITRLRQQIRNEYSLNSSDLLIGAAGRLVNVKGFKYLIQAAKDITKKYSNVKFMIIGDGPLREELQQEIISHNLVGNVIITGFKEDILNYINALDVFVISSIHEGIPMVLLEAMMLSKPIITTSVGGIPEIVDGSNGLLITPNNPGELSIAIQTLLNDKTLRDQLADNGRNYIANNLNISRKITELIEIYKRCLPE